MIDDDFSLSIYIIPIYPNSTATQSKSEMFGPNGGGRPSDASKLSYPLAPLVNVTSPSPRTSGEMEHDLLHMQVKQRLKLQYTVYLSPNGPRGNGNLAPTDMIIGLKTLLNSVLHPFFFIRTMLIRTSRLRFLKK